MEESSVGLLTAAISSAFLAEKIGDPVPDGVLWSAEHLKTVKRQKPIAI